MFSLIAEFAGIPAFFLHRVVMVDIHARTRLISSLRFHQVE